MKFWTWGYSQSYAADPQNDPTDRERPYIELWEDTLLNFSRMLVSEQMRQRAGKKPIIRQSA